MWINSKIAFRMCADFETLSVPDALKSSGPVRFPS